MARPGPVEGLRTVTDDSRSNSQWQRRRLRSPVRLTDHLLRSSIFNFGSTVATAGLGFFYWLIAARTVKASVVGYAAGAMSLAAALSLLTCLGINNFLVERLPPLERSPQWGDFLAKCLWPATVLTAVLSTVAEVLFARSLLGASRHGHLLIVALVVAAAGLTFTNVLDKVFLSARRADLGLVLNSILGSTKLLSLAGALLIRPTVDSLLFAWSAGVVVTSLIAAFGLVPRLRQGRLVGPRWQRAPRSAIARVFGHHVTSLGAMMTPLLLPPLVVYRLSATDNAYFYSTWMLGSVFLIISPAIAASLFAEGARDLSSLPAAGRRALRLLGYLLPLPILVGVVGGHEILRIFGRQYADHGFLLLATLAISAIPDAVTNVAVPLLRLRGSLRWSATLNVGMGILALGGAWVAMPWFGIVGAGLAWLLAQTVGAVAVAPFLSSVLGWRRTTAAVAAESA